MQELLQQQKATWLLEQPSLIFLILFKIVTKNKQKKTYGVMYAYQSSSNLATSVSLLNFHASLTTFHLTAWLSMSIPSGSLLSLFTTFAWDKALVLVFLFTTFACDSVLVVLRGLPRPRFGVFTVAGIFTTCLVTCLAFNLGMVNIILKQVYCDLITLHNIRWKGVGIIVSL